MYGLSEEYSLPKANVSKIWCTELNSVTIMGNLRLLY